MNKRKVAFFDFCETLADFQTADAFVGYTIEHYSEDYSFIWSKVYRLLRHLKLVQLFCRLFPNRPINKRLVLFQLRGCPRPIIETAAERYYLDVVKPHLIPEVIDELRSLQKSNFEIVIVSGGYSIYERLFARDFDIPYDRVIANDILFEKDRCTGKWEGEDCMRDEKIHRMEKLYDRDEIYSVAISDSLSDLPLWNWASYRVLVKRKTAAQISAPFVFDEVIAW